MIPAKEYMIVSCESKSALRDDVQKLIAVGWQPQGGVSVAVMPSWDKNNEPDGYDTEYIQAMVR